ncbi:MAG: cupin [Deltaproteobacteria bacterium]|nr:MAG: cupin [Deltaproteobacteria bacterium]
MKSANLLKEIVYNDQKPAITVLFETATTKEIRIVFKKDQHMKKHQTAFPITVEMVDGELDFGVEDTVHSLVKGDILSLDGDVPHDLAAKSDAIVRLTLSKSDSIQRVKDVIDS